MFAVDGTKLWQHM